MGYLHESKYLLLHRLAQALFWTYAHDQWASMSRDEITETSLPGLVASAASGYVASLKLDESNE